MNLTIYVRVSATVLILMFIGSCSSDPNADIPEDIASIENLKVIKSSLENLTEINVQREARYGDTDEVIIGQMGGVSVDDRGWVYISDLNRLVIHVYETDGSHITEIGGEGDGPGEFRRISSVQPHGDYLHVMDGSSLRISRFRMDDFSFVDDVAVPFEGNAEGGYIRFPGSFSVLNPDTYMIHFGVGYSSAGGEGDKPKIAGRILSRTSGTFEDELVYEFEANEAIVKREEGSIFVMPMDYNRSAHVEIDQSKRLIHGWSDDLLFKIYNEEGSYSRAVYVPYEKTPLNRNEIIAEYADAEEPWASMIRNDDMPDTLPAFNSMLVDDEGRIWISLFTNDSESYTWMVIDLESEEIVGTFIRSRAWRLTEVRDGAIYARVTDEETGLMEVVKYGFDL